MPLHYNDNQLKEDKISRILGMNCRNSESIQWISWENYKKRKCQLDN